MSCGCSHLVPQPDCAGCVQHLALMQRLDRQTELLAELAEVLASKRYRNAQEALEDGTGRATIDFPLQPGGVNLVALVERYTVSTNSTGTPVVGVYVLDAAPKATTFNSRDLVDWTNLLTATGDQTQPILIKGGEHLVFQWTGLSVGARCTANLQYRRAWQALD